VPSPLVAVRRPRAEEAAATPPDVGDGRRPGTRPARSGAFSHLPAVVAEVSLCHDRAVVGRGSACSAQSTVSQVLSPSPCPSTTITAAMSDARGMPLLSGPPTLPPAELDVSCRKCNKDLRGVNSLLARERRCNHCGSSCCSRAREKLSLNPSMQDICTVHRAHHTRR
jgi:hypothetical protein